MVQYDEYRRNVEECRQQARAARNETDRAKWLRLARDYQTLLPKGAPNAEEAFDAKQKAKGTGQKNSSSSH